MASNDILKNLKERDVKAGRGYINDLGEYVSYEEDQGDGRREGRKSESSIYMPPGGTAAKFLKQVPDQMKRRAFLVGCMTKL